MANVPVIQKEFGTPAGILMFPDNYQAYAHTFLPDDAAAATVNSRKVIKAGTIYPANDATAKGVVLYDCDVTDGTATGAIVFEGAIKVGRIPVAPSADALKVLTKVKFFNNSGLMVPAYTTP